MSSSPLPPPPFINHPEAEDSATKIHSNVYLAQNRYRGTWGHVSLVWMELSGFWELLDLADWDHVINLSVADYPLRRSREIARLLGRNGYRDFSFIGTWIDSKDLAVRIFRPHLPQADRPDVDLSMRDVSHLVGLRSPPYADWSLWKCHQWMILTRDFVSHLRTDAEALHLLAFMEHAYIPDETFFCQVAVNHPHFREKLIPHNKRFHEFGRGTSHPHVLSTDWVHKFPEQEEVGAEPDFFFVRKVYQYDPSSYSAGRSPTDETPGQKLISWIKKNHMDKHLVPEEYEDFEGKQFVPSF